MNNEEKKTNTPTPMPMDHSKMDVLNIIKLSRATYLKNVQNLIWAAGYNIIAIPLAAGVLASRGIVIIPAIGAAIMSLSTIIVAINARLLKIDYVALVKNAVK